MTLYSFTAVEQLMNEYYDRGGLVEIIEEGVLGYGFLIMHGTGLKTSIVKEVYLNEWSSAHTIRMYNKMPKKYEHILEDYWKKEEEEIRKEREEWKKDLAEKELM